MDTGSIPAEAAAIFGMFFDGMPVSCRTVSTGRDAPEEPGGAFRTYME